MAQSTCAVRFEKVKRPSRGILVSKAFQIFEFSRVFFVQKIQIFARIGAHFLCTFFLKKNQIFARMHSRFLCTFMYLSGVPGCGSTDRKILCNLTKYNVYKGCCMGNSNLPERLLQCLTLREEIFYKIARFPQKHCRKYSGNVFVLSG